MKRKLNSFVIGLLLVTFCVAVIRFSAMQTNASAKMEPATTSRISAVVACPGRVEGQSRTVDVGAAIDGIVESIRVAEGQNVARGQVLATIGCSDLRSALQVVRAEAESLKHVRERLLQGSRPEEREMAAQRTAAARSVLAQNKQNAERYEQLWRADACSKLAYEEARRDFEVSTAKLQEAVRAEQLVNAPPHEADLARADADIRAAADRIDLAEDRLSKCVVRAPMAGSILRVNLREGESFALLSPRPLFSLADVSVRRVRAEVDERDIGKVHPGQKAIVTSDAFADSRFEATVSEISSLMGRKSVSTGDPADKADRDILEVVLNLDGDAAALPLGLRVAVQFVK
jgi:HlyD family secretion protein